MGKLRTSIVAINKIQQLRGKGYSLSEISKFVKIPSTTVYKYAKNIKILPRYIEKWSQKRGGSSNRKLLKIEKAIQEARLIVNKLTYKEKMLFLSALYWGEGSKKDFGLSNTDPELIKVFVTGLEDVFGVTKERLRVSVRIYEDLDKEECLCYWSKIIGIPKDSIVNVNIISGKKSGKLKYGLCRVRVTKGGDLLKKINSINQITKTFFAPIA